MADLSLRHVSKRFGQVEVIRDLSLEIQSGEFAVFLGPSGCGKSTLLRMIAGLETLGAGEIHLGGARIDTIAPGDRGVAMVFQHYALYPHMTVRQNMAFGLRNIATPPNEIERKIADAAEMLEIAELLERKPGQLSGGQRQRVAIGRAIVKQPRAFLFDEPLSNLDAALRSRTRIELARLHQRVRATMIFVTHDQVEAMTLADRLIVMNGGVAEQIGTPMDVYDKPATTFVAGFIGSPAMNFMSGKVADSRQSIDLTSTGAAKVNLPLNGPTSAAPGTPVSVGIRPEHMLPYANGPLELDIELAEPLGADTLLHGKVGAMRELMTIRLPGHVLAKPGDKRRFNIDAKNLHLFEQQSGKRIADV